MRPEKDLAILLATLDVKRAPGRFVFVGVDAARAAALPSRARIVEDEGTTLVMAAADADAHGLRYDFVAAWLTLTVHSALDAVGLTAAVAGALAEEGIACNVLAGLHHDHLLVPESQADAAIARLRALSAEG